jgi:hypothetical protein
MSAIPVAADSTHAPRPANHVSNRSYQRERVNVFVPPNIRHQLDVLRLEWDVPLTEAVRRVLGSGLRNIMLTVPIACDSERREPNGHQSLARFES